MQFRRSLFNLTHLAALTALGLLLLLTGTNALAQDVIRPAAISDLAADRGASDVELSWSAISADVAGGAETIDHYNVYRGTTPDFVADLIGGSNLIGSSPTPSFSDLGALLDGFDYYYRVTAVDVDGNESNSKAPLVSTPPTLSGFWTNTSIEIDWTDAQPAASVFGYRVYHGPKSGEYDTVVDVNLVTSHSILGLPLFKNRYIVVTAIDADGNESGFSNEHIDVIRGIVRTRAHDGEELCWGNDCTPNPGVVQRNGGWQALVPIEFPEGDWNRVLMTFTMEARLCTPPNGGNVTKCGSGNPCVSPPCNGGYNTCGDPWDRLAHVFMVLDDCIDGGGSCITHNNLELMRAVTSFGTDAEPPEGTGFVPPRELTLDITPYTPLLTGQRYIGVEIGHLLEQCTVPRWRLQPLRRVLPADQHDVARRTGDLELGTLAYRLQHRRLMRDLERMWLPLVHLPPLGLVSGIHRLSPQRAVRSGSRHDLRYSARRHLQLRLRHHSAERILAC